jgi:pentalenic acid synthase
MTSAEARKCPMYPMERPDPLAPPPEFKRLRDEEPVSKVQLWDGSTAWLVTSYDLAREVYKDTRFSSSPEMPGFPLFSPGSAVVKKQDRSLLRMDPPEHRVHRKMLVPEFSPRRSETYLPDIRAEVESCVKSMLAKEPPVDFVKEFALPVPSLVICKLLGVPYEEHEAFHRHSRIRVSQASTPDDVAEANKALMDLLDKLVTRKESEPEDDLISRLVIAAQDGEKRLSHDELVMMAVLMLFAGHETTANMLSLSVLTLLRHPEQLDELRADPSLMPAAVEELMRFLSIAHVSPARAATEDIEVGGKLIRAGEGVIIPLIAANWDEQAFPEPERFDIHRSGVRNQIGFGYGVHQCIGQTLARLELQVGLRGVIEGIPTLRLAADIDDLPFKHEALFYGLDELPVAW